MLDAARSQLREIVRTIPVCAPLPNIAAHIVKAKAVRRERFDWRSALVAVFHAVLPGKTALPDVRRPLAIRLQLVAPCEPLSIQPAARRKFKLGFGRQTLACPLRISPPIFSPHLRDPL